MLKKTVYFISLNRAVADLETATQDAIKKRDAFMLKNEDVIGSIDQEDIKVATYSNQTLAVIIQLSYYPKPS